MTTPLLLAAILALADPAISEDRAALPAFQAGIGAVVIPVSQVLSGRSGENSAGAGATMFGLTPSLDRRISSHLTVGLAVPVVFNVREAQYAGASWTQAEVLMRLTAWRPVGGHVRLFGLIGSGIYRIFVPASERGDGFYDNPTGIAAVLGTGAQWAPASSWFLSGDVGIDAGFKLGSMALGESYAQALGSVRLGLGIGVPF